MSSADPAPPEEHDPATTATNAGGAHDQAKKDHKLTDSKGWDGKLRIDKLALAGSAGPTDADAQSEPEESEDEGFPGKVEDGPPPEQLDADEDLLEEYADDEEDIDLVHMKVASMAALKLERFKHLKRLCLRQNQISAVDIPESLAPSLQEIDLYDNLIAHIKGFDAFTELTYLDLSFNKIKHIKRINHLTKLRDLFFVSNKISAIEGLDGLNLRQIELGSNRIRAIENIETLTGLEELWLGKNKITELRGLNTLTNLKILSIQSNRLTAITGLSNCPNLEELYVSHNAISEISGLEANTNLRTVDVTHNPIEHLANLKHLEKLEEFWASTCKLSSFQEIEEELGDMKNLQTVYFEGNPLQLSQPVLYRNKVRLALPQIKQIDATFVQAG